MSDSTQLKQLRSTRNQRLLKLAFHGLGIAGLRDKAALCLEEDRFKEAEEALTQAVALARQSDNDDNLAASRYSPTLVEVNVIIAGCGFSHAALYEFGRCFWAQRMFKEAEPPLKQALEFQRDRSDARADSTYSVACITVTRTEWHLFVIFL
jgi:tetratricopeptide (TPR) repeat protein